MSIDGKFIAVVSMAIVVAGILEAAETTNALSNPSSVRGVGPRIVLAEPYYDFGRIPADKIVSHNFVFTNTGDQVLKISEVRSSCGCTTATNWNREVGPGQTGILPVLFNTGGMAGLVQKNLWVLSNDPEQPSSMILFTATVWKLIDAIPSVATFTFGADFQTNETRIVRLVSNLSEPVILSEPICTNNSFKTKLTTIVPGKEFELEIAVLPPLGPGSLTVPITIKSSSVKMPVVTVTAYAMVRPALTLTPAKILLPPMPLENAEEYAIRIKNAATNAVILSEPTVNYKEAGIKLRELQSGRLYELIVSFPKGFLSRTNEPVEVRLKSNLQQSPVVNVPVLQIQNSVFD